MKTVHTTRVFPIAVIALYLGSYACGPENSLVGGLCAGARCPSGDGSTDGSLGDGSNVDGARPDGSGGDGSRPDGTPGDGSGGDGGEGSDGGGDAQAPGDGACVPPFNQDNNCGTCGNVCVTPNSMCQEISLANFACRPPCVAPLSGCGPRCVDKQTDPENCGLCGTVCPTFFCSGGLCQGSIPGDIILIGHDFRQPSGASSQGRLLVNALFAGAGGNIRVLSYEQFSDAGSVANAKAAISSLAGGRTVNYTVTSVSSDLGSTTLSTDYDAVLIHDQVNATSAEMNALGSGRASALSTYTHTGGNVVVLDGGLGQMPSFLTSAGLLAVSGHTALVQYTPVKNVAPSDAVGRSVPSPYAAFNNSATFTTTEVDSGDVTYVVRQGSTGLGLPVVIHKVVP